MKVKLYGVRGSVAVAGDETRRYGGNTPCVAVEAGGQVVIFDAGTGIRKLGNDLTLSAPGSSGVDAHLFLSHLHWDHIQGFPFFSPAFRQGNKLSIYGVQSPVAPILAGDPATLPPHEAAALPPRGTGSSVRAALAAQMTAPNFPVGLDMMRAELRFVDVPYGEPVDLGCPVSPVTVRHVGVDHPNGCVAYRVDHAGKSVVYATDLELAEGTRGAVFDGLVELAHDADLLVFDAMYTPEEYAGSGTFSRRGWGHSTFEMGAAVAEAAGVSELCLFHHDPAHDDTFMDRLHERALARFAATSVAREGVEISL